MNKYRATTVPKPALTTEYIVWEKEMQLYMLVNGDAQCKLAYSKDM